MENKMKYYKTKTDIRAIEVSQEFLIQDDWIEITKEEMLAITNPPKTNEQIIAEQVQEYKLFLGKTDKKVLPDYEFKEGDNSLEWYIEEISKARAFIRANEVI